MRQKIASIAQMLRLPAICVLCNQYHQSRLAVCADCNQFFKPLGPCCRFCALPLPDGNFMVCGQCCKKKPFFDQAIAAWRFEEPFRSLVHQFKYHDGLYLRNFLATSMLQNMPADIHKTQCLMPVPMHPKRLRHRGFNQAAELAKYLAQILKLPCDLSSCQKILNTAPQAELNGKQRQQNLRGAFVVQPHQYQHITLVDDLLTTGSTANELARALKKQGAVQVDVWCCARVVKQG